MGKVYSQNSEQEFILFHFKGKPNGKFVDIGAYDTEKFSNVRALYNDLNFKGVLVEPAPQNYAGIAASYANDPEITVLNVALGENNSEIDFYDCGGDAISSSEISHRDKWAAAGVQYTKIKVQQMAVVDFFNQYGKGTDFLSVDTESTNIAIFRLIPDWVWEQISMLCIEHDNCTEEIEDKLIPMGFNTVYVNAENIILSKT
jgi:FkbM family methyltransferase